MLKLKLQYFGHLMRTTDSFEKTLMLGKIEDRRRRGWQRMRWLDGITNSMTWVWVNFSGSWWWTGKPGMLQSMGSQSRTWLGDWTELTPTDLRLVYHLVENQRICLISLSLHPLSLDCWTPSSRFWQLWTPFCDSKKLRPDKTSMAFLLVSFDSFLDSQPLSLHLLKG